jgi:hypothetical protein
MAFDVAPPRDLYIDDGRMYSFVPFTVTSKWGGHLSTDKATSFRCPVMAETVGRSSMQGRISRSTSFERSYRATTGNHCQPLAGLTDPRKALVLGRHVAHN